ncbi:hypothetical protein MMC19_000935, partial [Ptychographa xylographoides]|nr:hypothetical protein [Ptychographa xylographoides]
DFDVSIFLTEMSTSHEVLLRRRMFVAKGARLKSNSGKMTGTREEPAEVGDDEATEAPVLMRRESEEEKPALAMQDIPAASTAHEGEAEDENAADHQAGEKNPVVVSDDSGSEDAFQRQDPASEHEEQEDKKKMAMNTSYDGFRIYGRILCLVVKRKGGAKGKQAGNGAQGQGGGGGAMMEEWIASTQVGRDEEVVGDE